MAYRIIISIILLAFYACYLLKMLSQRRQGIRTDQLGRSKKGKAQVIELLLKIGSFIALAAGAASIVLYKRRIQPLAGAFGIALTLLGTLVFIKAVIDMHSNWRAGVSESEETELVTGGIFALSRNPAFLGFDLTYIGTLIAFFNIPLLVITAATIALFHLQIVCVEEEFLEKRFDASYEEYRQRVFRYFGRKRIK